jgi:hypothetical protein
VVNIFARISRILENEILQEKKRNRRPLQEATKKDDDMGWSEEEIGIQLNRGLKLVKRRLAK